MAGFNLNQELNEKRAKERRLSKMEGRHLRLFNRLSYKNALDEINKQNEPITALENKKKELEKIMTNQELPLLRGVASALYSKLDGSITYTRFPGANLGLVITNDDVSTNMDLINLPQFMMHGKVEGRDGYVSNAFENATIENTDLLKKSENNNANIAKNATITNSKIGEYSNNKLVDLANSASMMHSRVANYSINENCKIANNATITTNSHIANYTKNFDVELIGENTLVGGVNMMKKDMKSCVGNYSHNTFEHLELARNLQKLIGDAKQSRLLLKSNQDYEVQIGINSTIEMQYEAL